MFLFCNVNPNIKLNVNTNYVEYVGRRNAIFEYMGTYNMTQVTQKIQPYLPMPLKVFLQVKKDEKICTIYLLEEKSKLPL